MIQHSVAALMSQFMGAVSKSDVDRDTIGMLDTFRKWLELYTIQATKNEQVKMEARDLVSSHHKIQSLSALEQAHAELKEQLDQLSEERVEWQLLSNQMAEKLEELRKGVLYELTNQLQLPVDEEEAGAMSKKIVFSEGQSSALNEIVQATNGIDAKKFVNRIRKKMKESHELTRRWHKEYKELKGKGLLEF